jgi:hypothetical protein
MHAHACCNRWQAKMGAHEVISLPVKLLDGPLDTVKVGEVCYSADASLQHTAKFAGSQFATRKLACDRPAL